MSEEKVVGIVKCYSSNRRQLAVSIPTEVTRRLGLMSGVRFLVKLDDRNRIVFEPIEISSKNEPLNKEVSDK
jgi:hypothetical protein